MLSIHARFGSKFSGLPGQAATTTPPPPITRPSSSASKPKYVPSFKAASKYSREAVSNCVKRFAILASHLSKHLAAMVQDQLKIVDRR